jgi:hypothetical protein
MNEELSNAELFIYWCPRCNVQSESKFHLCRPGAPLFPQTADETSCQRYRVVLPSLPPSGTEGTT